MPSHWCRAEGRLGAKVARPASDLVGCEAVETKTPDALCEWCRNGGEDDSKSIDVRQRELDRATVTAAGMSQADSSTAESLEPKAESHNAAVSSIAPARPAPKVVVCVHCGRETLRSLRTCHRCHKSLPRDEEPLLGWHDIPRGAYDKGQLSTHPDMPSEAREGDDGNPVGRGRGVRIGLWILFVLLGAVAVWMAINLRAKPDISERQSAGSEATVAPSGDTRSTAGMEAPKTVAVPAGMFWMGCNERVDTECYDNEKPGRKVSVAAFEIDRTEVTVAAYRKCVTAGACSSAEPSTDGRGTVQGCNWNSGRENHPVNCVDWSQASAYCKWAGGRLPTEAEWEKAARGTDGRKYPWGNTDVRKSRAYGNVHLNASGDLRETMPVGSYPAGASPYGALDMIGNVTEWVESKSRTYPGQKGEFHRLKGDSWYGMASASRPSYISEYDETRVPFIGFRCARTPRS